MAGEYFEKWISSDGIIEKAGAQPDLPGSWWRVDEEMVDGVDLYLGTVRGDLDELPGSELFVEVEVHPVPALHDIMWGTADAIVIQPWGDLVVRDFKYGKGVLVMPEFNDQGMFYALGAMHFVGAGEYDVNRVRIGIVQPRKPDQDGEVDREWVTTPRQLLSLETQLERAVEATEAADAPLNPGAHCKFCPAELTCPALQRLMVTNVMASVPDDLMEIEVEDVDVRYPDVTDGPAILRARKLWSVMKSWGKRVEEITHEAAQLRTPGLGLKLVDGEGHRRWLDTNDAAQELVDEFDFTPAEIFEPRTLRSPAQIEKLITGKKGKEWVNERVMRPRTDPKLVPETDSRPAIATMMDMLDAAGDVD